MIYDEREHSYNYHKVFKITDENELSRSRLALFETRRVNIAVGCNMNIRVFPYWQLRGSISRV